MNDRSRTERRIVKARKATTRNARRSHTLASHGRLAGLDESLASGVGGALRSKAKACGITGEKARLFRRNHAGQKLWRQPVSNARRYSREEFSILVDAYRPRAARQVAAKTVLMAYVSA